MVPGNRGDDIVPELQNQLKALGNRHAVEILEILSPRMGDIIPSLGWDGIVDGILQFQGIDKHAEGKREGRSQAEAKYQKARQKFVSGGTLYETMNKLIKVGFVSAEGTRGRKNRQFRITHDGRLALLAISGMRGPISPNTEVRRAAQVLLRHKNFTTLMPAQKKFLDEVGVVDKNLIIQMPPGSGKTFLAMIAILIRLERGIRCLYFSPYTSLNSQVIEEYGELFRGLGYRVARHDGRHRSTTEELENADLIVSIIESVLTAVTGNEKWTQNIGLAIIDEFAEIDSQIIDIDAQSLGTDRSTKLDVLITQLKQKVQLIALSSRFGETDEASDWLEADVFRPSVRLTPDEYIVTMGEDGIEVGSADGTHSARFKGEDMLGRVLEHMGNYEEKAFLVVAGSRFGAEFMAQELAKSHPRQMDEEAVARIIGQEGELPVTRRLRDCLTYGVAFHHSGLNPEVRDRLERSIKDGIVKTVVSTTGITSGMSFPFDSVIILIGRGLYFFVSRSKYLQIAGRIGEYYLSRNGGSIYLVFESPTRQFPDVEKLEETLLHKPLSPLTPGQICPSLAASLVMKNAASGHVFTRAEAKEEFMKFASGTFRGSVDEEYSKYMEEIFKGLFSWLVKAGLLESIDRRFRITKEGKAVITAGLGPIEYVAIRKQLDTVDAKTNDSEIIDILLRFGVPQSARPKALVPEDIEIKLAGVDPPSERYHDFKQKRDAFKKLVLCSWVEEQDISTIIEHALDETSKLAIGQSPPVGTDFGEGDVEMLVGICSDIALSLSQYNEEMKKKDTAKRLRVMSMQLLHGVRRDLASADLFDLTLPAEEGAPERPLTRYEIRTLHDRGYKSISNIVRKDIDPEKAGFARDRFAANCGLDSTLAKRVYRTAMNQIKAQLS
ncbi:MAG: DEAD/DEAH box helicase [Candidatus Thorarchaeota archaeon]|nr:DEAD/DEAH box helicase [Candidatus Thorarchaeota archaeon]